MFLTDNNIIYRKNFTFYNANKNWNSFKKTAQRQTLQLLNILIKKQINFILDTYGKKKNKVILWTKKRRRVVSFNKILKQKLKNKKIYFLLKNKKNFFVKRNKKKNILFLNFMENFFFWNRRIINILWKLKKKIIVTKSLKLIKKIIKHKRKIMSRKKKRKDRNKYKLMFYVEKLKKKRRFFKKKISILKSKRKMKFIKIKKFFVYFCQKEKIKIIKKVVLDIDYLVKKKKLMKILKVKIDSLKKNKKFLKIKNKRIKEKKIKKNRKIIRVANKVKKYKFFKNKIKVMRNKTKIRKKWKKRRRLLKMKKKEFEKRLKEIKWKVINVKNISRKRTILNFLLGWNSFFNNYFVNTKKVLKKRRISLASYTMHNINKKIVVLITIFKNKRRLQKKPRQKSNDWHYNVIRTLTKQKALKKFYKKINSILLSIKIKQNWNRMNKTPVFFKTLNYFSGSTTKGWKKIVKIMKKSYYLQRFSKNIYFENTLFNTLISCYFKNPENLTKNLGENLRKQWKHRQQLFFLYYLIMSVLWKFGLKKIASYRKIKSIYMMIRGKINSGTRTKYFQIKASYKPSFLSYQNHMSFAKGVSKAKTGIFGIKSWIHY